MDTLSVNDQTRRTDILNSSKKIVKFINCRSDSSAANRVTRCVGIPLKYYIEMACNSRFLASGVKMSFLEKYMALLWRFSNNLLYFCQLKLCCKNLIQVYWKERFRYNHGGYIGRNDWLSNHFAMLFYVLSI